MKHTAFTTILILMILLLSVAQAAARALCVSAPRANLRAGPGKEHRISWEVNQYMPLVQVGQKEDWIKVSDVDGDIHWVYKELVSDEIQCVTVSEKKANIRQKPSSGAKKWFTVEQYTSFKKAGEKDKWVEIEFKGKTMWVFHTLVWPR